LHYPSFSLPATGGIVRENISMQPPRRCRFLTASLVCLLLAATAQAQSRNKRAYSSPDFSYYMLVLSYAPDFCDQPTGNKDPRECGTGRRVGFIVHGLWPQGEDSRGPQNCGGASPVSRAILQVMLNYIPTESLIQHEWATHGTCSGLGVADYFAAVRQARDSITLPPDLNQPSQREQFSPAQIEQKVAATNPRVPRTAFRASCYRDGELQEIRVCLNKDLSPRACGASAGMCTASNVTLLPVR
jgi:ribonuclease T2